MVRGAAVSWMGTDFERCFDGDDSDGNGNIDRRDDGDCDRCAEHSTGKSGEKERLRVLRAWSREAWCDEQAA